MRERKADWNDTTLTFKILFFWDAQSFLKLHSQIWVTSEGKRVEIAWKQLHLSSSLFWKILRQKYFTFFSPSKDFRRDVWRGTFRTPIDLNLRLFTKMTFHECLKRTIYLKICRASEKWVNRASGRMKMVSIRFIWYQIKRCKQTIALCAARTKWRRTTFAMAIFHFF